MLMGSVVTDVALIDATSTEDALMMGGTFMPTPSQRWLDAIVTDYIDPATGGHYTPVMVATPESGANSSIPTGLANLQAAMNRQPAGQPYLIEGYSQSAQIAVDEELHLIESGKSIPDVSLFLLGSGNRPDGGFLERFDGLVIPGFAGFDFNGAEPTDAGIPTVDFAAQYDAVGDFPQYPLNLLADVNSLLGFLYTHASYGGGPLAQLVPDLWPASKPLEGPFTDQYVLGSTEIVKQVFGDTTFYFVPTTQLPLLDPLRSLGVPESVLNIIQPALQVIIEAGYDRAVPFGDPTPAQLIPIIDPVTFVIELANAVVQGADNAVKLFGAQLPGYPQLIADLDAAQVWSEKEIGVPYGQVVTWLDDNLNPFTAFTAIEGPIGHDFQDLLNDTGIQQDLIDPVLGLVGTLGGLLTS